MPPIVTYAPKMPVPAWSEIAETKLKTSRDNLFMCVGDGVKMV